MKKLVAFAMLLTVFLAAAILLKVQQNQISKSSQLITAVDSLPKRTPAVISTRLAKGLAPPTNKWYSSLALSNDTQPVFSYPLSYKPIASGFSYGVPLVVGSPNAIFGSHLSDINVDYGTSSAIVESYDDLSVSVGLKQNDTIVATNRITQGSPFIFSQFKKDVTVKVSTDGLITKLSSTLYTVKIGERYYGISSPATITAVDKQLVFSAKAGEFASYFSYYPLEQKQYFEAARNPIMATSARYEQKGENFVTKYNLSTKGGPTIFASLPAMKLQNNPMKGTFNTVLGTQKTYRGNQFNDIKVAAKIPSSALNISSLSDAERQSLITSLKSDAADLEFKINDSYFGAKEVYRAANLLQLAYQLDQKTIAQPLQKKLAARLGIWFDTKGGLKRDNVHFYYDTSYKGVVAEQASFGSENFNDHHFHYGYFIYASAILGRYDANFVRSHGLMVNTLIADIASPESSDDFMKLRVFDLYAGHSWASGNGNFADGTNQESTSEAINAWYAIHLWSQVIDNPMLANQSHWLYTLETKAAQTYWLNVTAQPDTGPSYAHSYAGIVWSGKVDYSTFFSARPQSILGIQLIPMSPAMQYLANDQQSIRRNLESTVPDPQDYEGQFHDYLLMYKALLDGDKSTLEIDTVSTKDIDDSNSRTYLLAWLLTQNN